MKREEPFSHAIKLTWPNALPLTTTWFDSTRTASAISGLETEKRSIGWSNVSILDWPTSTLTGMASLVPVEKEAFVLWSCAETANAHTRVVTRTTVMLRMKRRGFIFIFELLSRLNLSQLRES